MIILGNILWKNNAYLIIKVVIYLSCLGDSMVMPIAHCLFTLKDVWLYVISYLLLFILETGKKQKTKKPEQNRICFKYIYLFSYVLGLLIYMQSYWLFVNELYATLLAFCEWEN